jgi:hypothetical protein
MPATNTNSIALQLEKVRTSVPMAFEAEDVLLDLFEERGDIEKVSSRAVRVPIKLRPGGKATQGTGDFDDMGRGSGSIWDFATVSTLPLRFAVEVSKLAEYATDEKSKSVENVATEEVANGMEMFKAFLDRLTQTNGTGLLDNIGATYAGGGSTTFPVVNPNMFYYNQDIQVYNAAMTVNRGICTVIAVDPLLKTIVVNVLPGGTIAGDALVINIALGTSGANPSSLQGLQYSHVDSSAGSWQNLARSAYPEALKTPHVAAGGAGLTPAMARLAMAKIERVLGVKRAQKEPLVAYMNIDMRAAWENTGIQISEIIMNDVTGKNMPDILREEAPKTMGGRRIITSIHALPARIDFIMLKHWWRAVTKAIDYFEEGGQTVFQLYGTSGGLLSGYIFYFEVFMQIGMDLPRFGAFIDGLALPAGY